MRPVILTLCAGVLLLGLPRLAVLFREPQNFGNRNIVTDAPGKRGAVGEHISHSFAAFKEPVVHAGPVAPPLPANEEALIAAIQKELARTGFYNGPITSAWTDGVRGAVRKFTGSGRTKPSPELLMSLRAAKPQIKEGVVHRGATMNLQAAQDMINGRIPFVTVTPPEQGISSDGYLPPWNALRARDLAQSLPPGAGRGTALTVRIATQSGPSHMEKLRRGRIGRGYSYASTPRRSRFLFTPYHGYFRY